MNPLVFHSQYPLWQVGVSLLHSTKSVATNLSVQHSKNLLVHLVYCDLFFLIFVEFSSKNKFFAAIFGRAWEKEWRWCPHTIHCNLWEARPFLRSFLFWLSSVQPHHAHGSMGLTLLHLTPVVLTPCLYHSAWNSNFSLTFCFRYNHSILRRSLF